MPESLLLAPADTLITEGESARLRVTVLDQDGEPFPIPSWAPPTWSYSVPGAVEVAPDGTLDALGGGEVRIDAELAGLHARTTIRVNPRQAALTAPTIYLIQATQNLAGDVPIVAGRRALLRVFTTSEPTSFYQPRGRASFYLDGEEVHSAPLFPTSYLIPSDVDESRIDRSFNAVIPGDVLQPGVEMVVELDVMSVVPLAPGSQIRVPEQGRLALDVRALPRMDLMMVPVLVASSPNPQIFNWTDGLTPSSAKLRFARSVLPIGDLDVEVHETFTTTADLTTEGGWRSFLREISVLRATEGSTHYYYGAVMLPSGSRWGGLGYIGAPASVGRPHERTLAHELGHNMSLGHAPCGGVASSDPDYPHDGGFTGVWGYDFTGGGGLGSLVDPSQYKDLMGYCSPRWISDYHFTRALEFRVQREPFPASGRASSPAREPVLLLWGGVAEGRITLEPAFVLDAPPRLPGEEGPYRLEGRDAQGVTRFSISFAPNVDSEGGRDFVFTVPMEAVEAEALATITLTGPEGLVTRDRSSPGPPVALVTDASTGRIRAIVRDTPVPAAIGSNADIVVSRGLPPMPLEPGFE